MKEHSMVIKKVANLRPEAPDPWVLNQRVKCYRMKFIADTLFEKVEMELLGTGQETGLLAKKEAVMPLYKRKRSPYYYFDLCCKGFRKRLSTRCTNKKDANQVMLLVTAKFLGDSHKLEEKADNVPTFREASEKYLAEQCQQKRSYEREKSCHKTLLPTFGNMRIDKITAPIINTWLQKEKQRIVRGDKKMAPRSININRGYLHRVFEFSKNVCQWIDDNPVKRIRPLPDDNIRDRILSREEEIRLLEACRTEWLKDAVRFSLKTGLRIGEIAGLQHNNFFLDCETPHFKISREKSRITTEFPLVSEHLLEIVHKYKANHQDGEYFFRDESGKPLTRYKIGHCFRRTLKKAGLEGLVFHDLRRTFFTRLRWQGCNPTLAEYLMGHKLPSLVARYMVFKPGDIANEMRKLEAKSQSHVTHTSHSQNLQNGIPNMETVEALAGEGIARGETRTLMPCGTGS